MALNQLTVDPSTSNLNYGNNEICYVSQLLSVESFLQSEISSSGGGSSLSTEISRAISAEASLTTQLSTETSRAISAELSLHNEISASSGGTDNSLLNLPGFCKSTMDLQWVKLGHLWM